MTLRRLGDRVGTVKVKIEIAWPIYEEHVDFMRNGSILMLQLQMLQQVERESRRKILDQLRDLAHADGWTPQQLRDRFAVCETPECGVADR